MIPWLPIPRAAATDPALALLSLAARAVVLQLALVAVDGVVPIPPGRTGADVADVACARAEGTRGAYAEAIAAGVLVEEAGVVVLPWEWPVWGASGWDGTTPREGRRASRTGHLKPSDDPVAVRVRDDRSRFGRRLKRWSKIPAGLTWEAWLLTPDGRAFTAARDEDFPGYADRVTPGVTPGSRPGGHAGVTPRDPVGGHAGVTPQGHAPPESVSISAVFSGKQEERGSDAREGSRPRVTPQGHAEGHTPTVACPTTEPVTNHAEAGELLMALRAAGLVLACSGAHEVELARLLTDLAVRGTPLPREGLARLTGHVREHLRKDTRTGSVWRPSLAALRGPDGAWTQLLSLLGEAAGCARCGATSTRPKPAPSTPTDSELRARRRAEEARSGL